MARIDRPRVLLLWPGGLFSAGANFGVPQLLAIAAAVRAASGAVVDVIDLDMERARGPVDLAKLVSGGYDLVGVSCYSSFDYLKVLALGERLRGLLPRAWLTTGGYHVSARPDDFTGPESPFDFAIIGDGEGPMARLAAALESGKRPLTRTLGPEPTADPNTLDLYDWSLLERYRPTARRVASQAEIYLSRGCPYDCAFCMERAKRDVSWRALEPLRAVDEMHRLDRFLDLRGWTLFVADALFGMKKAWRREFLEALARKPVRADKVWLLIRLDLVDREDIELMARANVAPGFGLETGDPVHLRRIRKTGKLGDHLGQMRRIAEWTRELNVPFGANVIVGHPGETEESLRTTASFLREVFLRPEGTTGFVSIDPFRLYPGSPIDEERPEWEASTGMRVHRYPWWHDGDQEFLSEWVDPSESLDFRACHRLRHELMAPIVRELAGNYVYDGPAAPYFRRAVDEQIELVAPARAARTLGMWHLWSQLVRSRAPAPTAPRDVASDRELASFCREARREVVDGLAVADPAVHAALLEIPRERFVAPDLAAESTRDIALPLSDDGRSTLSAMHAYVRAFAALELTAGDDFAELGAGTGYGGALAREVVGPKGRVRVVEIDRALAAAARANVGKTGARTGVEVVQADAHDVDHWEGTPKVSVTFAIDALPREWIAALPVGGRLVAPIGPAARQTLTLVTKRADGSATQIPLETVAFVRDRTARGSVHDATTPRTGDASPRAGDAPAE